LETLDVAGVHEQALNTVRPPEDAPGNVGQALLERADTFFKETSYRSRQRILPPARPIFASID
jgi:hypothetical protein